MLLTLVAFVFALAVLIAVHEWGHYRMAVACNVRVLRFSVGFGKPLLSWKARRPRPGQDTEFTLAAIPFGGYVKMLDEREAPVPAEERHRAFNTQPLRSRTLIVAAGPVANLLLAVLLYAAVNWIGVQEPRAVLAVPTAGSVAARAGLQGGEWVQAGALHGDALEPVRSFETVRWLITRGALDQQDVVLQVAAGPEGGRTREVTLPLSTLEVREADASMFRQIGITMPWMRAELGTLKPGGAAKRAGLQPGDVVQRVGSIAVIDAQQLRERIRAMVREGAGETADWTVLRGGRSLTLPVALDAEREGEMLVGRLGAYVGSPPAMVLVRYGLLEGLWAGGERVWEVSGLSLRLIGRMLTGGLSLKNLSGPISIADYAGKSASLGLTYFLGFLAFVSVSLGVLNLLPIPVLDGGHLMYYLWEFCTGRPVSETWLQRLQYVGMSLLLAMMAIAMFNDVTRHLG